MLLTIITWIAILVFCHLETPAATAECGDFCEARLAKMDPHGSVPQPLPTMVPAPATASAASNHRIHQRASRADLVGMCRQKGKMRFHMMLALGRKGLVISSNRTI